MGRCGDGMSLWESFYFVSEAMSSTEVEDGVGSVGKV